MRKLGWLAVFLPFLFAAPASAQVALDGFFVATEVCPAYQSFRNQTNPGNIEIAPGRAYEIVGANKADATHYWVRIAGVDPERRWVAIGCGTRTVTPDTDQTTNPATDPVSNGGSGSTQYVFAASWQPGFCESHSNKDECASQVEGRFDTVNFSLHGLWPQAVDYCNVPDQDRTADRQGRWDDLPAVEISTTLKAELDKVMPGTASLLERHEWTKHGTCYDAGAEEYFADSLAVMSALNASAVRELFADNIGKQITRQQIGDAFDQSFGTGAGDRVRVSCARDGSRTIITEITIGLTGVINVPEDVADLIQAAAPTSKPGCPGGIVDPVGLQ